MLMEEGLISQRDLLERRQIISDKKSLKFNSNKKNLQFRLKQWYKRSHSKGCHHLKSNKEVLRKSMMMMIDL